MNRNGDKNRGDKISSTQLSVDSAIKTLKAHVQTLRTRLTKGTPYDVIVHQEGRVYHQIRQMIYGEDNKRHVKVLCHQKRKFSKKQLKKYGVRNV